VRDYVVQLPRDPSPLTVGRRASVQISPSVELLRELAILTLADTTLTHRAAERPRRQQTEHLDRQRIREPPAGFGQLSDRRHHNRKPEHPPGLRLGRERTQPVEHQHDRRGVTHRQLVTISERCLERHKRHHDEHHLERPAAAKRDSA
jgi:hypothetical protein